MQKVRSLPGDILTACDNELQVPTGYLGHSAIVVDEDYMIEAVITFPYVQKNKIEDFHRVHPLHAHYRPNLKAMGEAAATCALWYFQQCMDHYNQGRIVPPFSFSPQIALEDAWSSIYCSKLVWLSYHYGANYSFYNDFLLFTPEDLDTVLHGDPNFTLLYKHPMFHFLINS